LREVPGPAETFGLSQAADLNAAATRAGMAKRKGKRRRGLPRQDEAHRPTPAQRSQAEAGANRPAVSSVNRWRTTYRIPISCRQQAGRAWLSGDLGVLGPIWVPIQICFRRYESNAKTEVQALRIGTRFAQRMVRRIQVDPHIRPGLEHPAEQWLVSPW